jgi:hypothetical protein
MKRLPIYYHPNPRTESWSRSDPVSSSWSWGLWLSCKEMYTQSRFVFKCRSIYMEMEWDDQP